MLWLNTKIYFNKKVKNMLIIQVSNISYAMQLNNVNSKKM